MGMQIKGFALLFALLLLVDAIAWRGEYRNRGVSAIASFFGSMHGLGPGRDWTSPRRARDD